MEDTRQKHKKTSNQVACLAYPEGVADERCGRRAIGPGARGHEEAVRGLGHPQLARDWGRRRDEELGQQLAGLVREGVVALEERRAVAAARQGQRVGAA